MQNGGLNYLTGTYARTQKSSVSTHYTYTTQGPLLMPPRYQVIGPNHSRQPNSRPSGSNAKPNSYRTLSLSYLCTRNDDVLD